MPVNPNTPEPLKTALTNMELTCQSTKNSLRFAAPEMFDTFWADMQINIAAHMETMYDDMSKNEESS